MATKIFKARSLANFLCLATLIIISCHRQSEQLADTSAASSGEKIFIEQCASCHSINKVGIGPALGGVQDAGRENWMRKFIKNPRSVIESGDERASFLFEKYKMIMPSFAKLSDEQMNDIIAFLKAQKLADDGGDGIDPLSIKDPIPQPIPMSELVITMKQVAVIPPSSNEGQLTRICKLDYRPDTKDIYVVDLRGKLYELRDGIPKVYLDLQQERPDFINTPGLATGFGSFAFHPAFHINGLLYTTHAERAVAAPADFAYNDSIKVTLQWVLTEWKTDQPDAYPFKGKGRELLRINMVHSYHGIQEITFNPFAQNADEDYGLLYLGIGDGTSAEYGYPFLAHSKEKIWGTIIRIDPFGHNSKNGKYGIPSGNPFVKSGNPSTVKEIYAYGFRNPHRITWTKSGKMLCSNIGQHSIESVHLVLKGNDYGWPMREGTFAMDLTKGINNIYPLPENDELNNFTYPVIQYDHDEGNAISGGFEYNGNSVKALRGKYLFGDIVKGRLFFVKTNDLAFGKQAPIKEFRVSIDGKIKSLTSLCGADKVDLRFGSDAEGEIYILTKPDGKIYKLMP
jgi:mono/diheme cytochrome c family protein